MVAPLALTLFRKNNSDNNDIIKEIYDLFKDHK